MAWSKRISTEFACVLCQKIFTKLISAATHIPKRTYCQNECRKSDKNSYKSEWTDERRAEYSEKFSGENNKNFNKRWSKEKREEFSSERKEICENNPELRYAYGNANRGVKFQKEKIEAMHSGRDRASYSHAKQDEAKRVIGEKSAAKFTPEFKAKFRKQMEEAGHWIPIEQKQDLDIYMKRSNWDRTFLQYLSEQSASILSSYGIFSKKNKTGYVRDHIFPRLAGFELGVPWYVLNHPENLQFIPHSDNIKKGFQDRKKSIDEKKIDLELLLEKILKQVHTEFKHHQACIDFINERTL